MLILFCFIVVVVMFVIIHVTLILNVSQDLDLLLELEVCAFVLYVVPDIFCNLVGVGNSLNGVCILAGVISCIFSSILLTDLPMVSYLSPSTERCHLPRSAVLMCGSTHSIPSKLYS